MRVEQCRSGSGSVVWCIVDDDGRIYSFPGCDADDLAGVVSRTQPGMMSLRYTPTLRYTRLVPPPVFESIPAPVPPPCIRCGTPIHVSKFFSNGRPCDCLSKSRFVGRHRRVHEITADHSILEGSASYRVKTVRVTPKRRQVVLTLSNGETRRYASSAYVLAQG
jgi:hypothetical protein